MRKRPRTQDVLPGMPGMPPTAVDGVSAAPATAEPRAASAPRLKPIDRRQMLFRTVDVERLVDEDHPARAIWAFVSRLDLSEFYAPIKAVEGVAGRETWDPLLLICLWLYAYSRGIGSAREVARRCEYDPALEWLTGMQEVNHHTLSDFRVDHAAALDDLFAQALGLLSAEGLITLERVMHDGTKVQASAGSDSFRREGRIREHLDETRKQVAAMGDPREDSTPRRRAARERAARERQERLEKALQELEKIRKTKAGEEARQEARASLTDPEAVFSSEAYGDAYARCLGAAHVSVDPQRRQVPCSATMIRNDPLAHLDCLAPCVREWFVRRVCLVGAESTGKTTLAVALAGHYQTVWMPEYGREFCDVKLANGTLEHWDSVEFEQIAREHARREDLLAREASRRRRARHDA